MREPRKNLRTILSLVVAATFAASCSPPMEYVASDIETFKAIAPEYSAYVEKDPALTMEQKLRRARTVDAWRIRVEQATGTKVK